MSLKEEIEEILHPPRAPKPIPTDLMKRIMSHESKPMIKGGKREPIASENLRLESTPESDKDNKGKSMLTDSKLTIDFNAIANASEFRRFIYWIRTGQVFRGSNAKLDIALKKTQENLEIIKAIPKYKEFTGVMNEFKSKLAKIQEKRDK